MQSLFEDLNYLSTNNRSTKVGGHVDSLNGSHSIIYCYILKIAGLYLNFKWAVCCINTQLVERWHHHYSLHLSENDSILITHISRATKSETG